MQHLGGIGSQVVECVLDFGKHVEEAATCPAIGEFLHGPSHVVTLFLEFFDDAHDGGVLHQVGIVGVQLVIIVEHWVRCKRGGKVEGFDCAFAGDVPLGAGLSSSAALESAFAFALNELFNGGSIDKFELAKIGQSTEHNYCGVKCGIMDQFASIFGKKGCLIRLNCKTLEHKYFPFDPQGYKLVLIDSCVKHELASSAYNKRRESCENAAAAIKKNHPEVDFLSDAKRVWLEEVREEIPEEDFLRAEYVIGEVQRVLDVCDALERGDYETVGEMMYQTHFGMSKLYEVSCPELDFLNKLARKCDVTGSRVMGGGFGGCTINLVKEELYDKFIEAVKEKFPAEFGHDVKIYDVVISDGARKVE